MRRFLLPLLMLVSVGGCGKMGSAEAERVRLAEQQAEMMAERVQQAKVEAAKENENARREIQKLKAENAKLKLAIAQLRERPPHPSADPAKILKGDAADSTGSLTGQILIDGVPPQLSPLVRQGASIKDAAVCAATDIPDESVIVGPKGGLANVFVYLVKSPNNYRPRPIPKTPVVFDRIACRFIPHVLIVRTGQTILVKNSDPVAHNIHTRPRHNMPYHQVTGAKDSTGAPLVYQLAETVPVRVISDFHAWMQAWHLPLDHPFAAISDASGRFEINEIPVGAHEFQVWHERAGLLESRLRVQIVADNDAMVELKYPSERFE